MMKKKFDNISTHPYITSIGIALGTIIGMLIGIFLTLFITGICRNPLSIYFQKFILINPMQDQFTSAQKNILNTLISKNIILNGNDLISNLSNFYTAIITFLGILLALSVFFGYIYMLFASKNHIDQGTENFLRRHIDSKKFNDELNKMVKQDLENYLEGTDPVAINEKISKLENEIEKISTYLTTRSKLDDAELILEPEE